MKMITPALALSVFVSFFVWISALSIADHRVPGWMGFRILHSHGLPPARRSWPPSA